MIQATNRAWNSSDRRRTARGRGQGISYSNADGNEAQHYGVMWLPILPRGLMVWHLILDQQVPGSNPGEAALPKNDN